MSDAMMRWLKKNFKWMSCREMSKVGSSSWEKDLGLADRLRLKAHMIICAPCRVVSANMKLLREAIQFHSKRVESDTQQDQSIQLTPEKKEKLKKKLRESSS